MINKELLKNYSSEYGVSLTDEMLNNFDKYAKMLVEKNKVMNLTAITEPDDIVLKHFADSLAIFNFVDIPKNATVIDVGAGAGFPSVPMLIARNDLDMTMLDSLNKRLVFLQDVLKETNINGKTVHSRGEDAGRAKERRENYDFAVARAVAPLNILCEYCLPLVKVGGTFVAMKGSKDEIQESKKAISKLGGEITNNVSYKLANGDARNIIMIKKISHTSTTYPRNSGKIAKAPL